MGICMNAKEIKDKFRKYFMVVFITAVTYIITLVAE